LGVGEAHDRTEARDYVLELLMKRPCPVKHFFTELDANRPQLYCSDKNLEWNKVGIGFVAACAKRAGVTIHCLDYSGAAISEVGGLNTQDKEIARRWNEVVVRPFEDRRQTSGAPLGYRRAGCLILYSLHHFEDDRDGRVTLGQLINVDFVPFREDLSPSW
jgi:hypothetical protein